MQKAVEPKNLQPVKCQHKKNYNMYKNQHLCISVCTSTRNKIKLLKTTYTKLFQLLEKVWSDSKHDQASYVSLISIVRQWELNLTILVSVSYSCVFPCHIVFKVLYNFRHVFLCIHIILTYSCIRIVFILFFVWCRAISHVLIIFPVQCSCRVVSNIVRSTRSGKHSPPLSLIHHGS